MWNDFKQWLHHLLDPHCDVCKAEKAEKEHCKTCEVLEHQLNLANHNLKVVLQQALSIPEPQAPIDTSEMKPIRTMNVPWRVRKEALEELDRQRAKTAKEKKEHAAATS